MPKRRTFFFSGWKGISLRSKITGVTVFLLTFGLAVAGIGTLTVLSTYLHNRVDDTVNSVFSQALTLQSEQLLSCNIRYEPRGYLVAILDTDGSTICSNVPDSSPQPKLSGMNLAWSVIHDQEISPLYDLSGKENWRVKTTFNPENYLTLVVGIDLNEVESTLGSYGFTFFAFTLITVLLGALATRIMVTGAFAPLRDVEATAARFASGDYSQRLGETNPGTEVGRLTHSLNSMLTQIDQAIAERQRSVENMRRFVSDASHELRTPLVSLRGYAELYRMGALQKPEDVAQAMERIENEAIRMGGLVEDLLALARLDEIRPLMRDPVDLLKIAQDAALDASASSPDRRITVLAPPAPTTKISLSTPTTATRSRRRRTPKQAPAIHTSAGQISPATNTPLPLHGPKVRGDENALRQVVTNLLGNARRFTPDDSPIELVVEVDQATDCGIISITDHGEGIPEAIRKQIFQRFWRADTSRTRDTGGAGLGLSIVAGIIERHKGQIVALETPGGGATFRVSIPLVNSKENHQLSPNLPKAEIESFRHP